MHNLTKFAASVFLLGGATVVEASDKRDFEGCDGRIHPGKQDDGMRGEPTQMSYSFISSTGKRGTDIAACTRSLASPRLLPTQNLRKAHLLRARAAAYLQQGETAKAIADLDLAESTAAGLANNAFYQRSMGVSLSLLRAVALIQSDKADDAAVLARAAIKTRPYSLQILMGAANILQAARRAGDGTVSPWLAAIPLEPALTASAVSSEAQLGNFAAVISFAENVGTAWPTEPLPPYSNGDDENSLNFLNGLTVSLDNAYARAATGDVSGARATLAVMKEKMAPAMATPDPNVGNGYMVPIRNRITRFVEARENQINARIAVGEGRTNEALALLVGAQLPRDAATVELLTALAAALPEKDRAASPDITPFAQGSSEQRKNAVDSAIPLLLIAPETPRSLVGYDKARPKILNALIGAAFSMGTTLLGGIDRTDGFRSSSNADGTTKVEFIGNTPSAELVQEMTLLRAAELTKAAGKTHFAITDRNDYARYTQISRNGIPESKTSTGFKTELFIRFMDNGNDAKQSLDALEIIDALGPYYYEEKKP